MVLATLINHPERLNRDTLYELRSIVARYPYFQTARLLMLNNMYLLHEPDFGTELRRSVLYVYDRRALCRLIEGHFEKVEVEQESAVEEPTVDRTMSLIDAFLGTLPEESEALQLSVDMVGDYAARFLMGDEAEEHETLSLNPSLEEYRAPSMGVVDEALVEVLKEITQAPEPAEEPQVVEDIKEEVVEDAKEDTVGEPTEDETEDEANAQPAVSDEELLDESYFTETLAKIYIKQHKYSRALEIIRSLYLKYPEKNIYFADQIRFLEKLIINNNSK